MAVYVDHLRSPGRIEELVCDVHLELMVPERAMAVWNGSLAPVSGYVCQREGCQRWFVDAIGMVYVDHSLHSFSNSRKDPACRDERRQLLYLRRQPSGDLAWTC